MHKEIQVEQKKGSVLIPSAAPRALFWVGFLSHIRVFAIFVHTGHV